MHSDVLVPLATESCGLVPNVPSGRWPAARPRRTIRSIDGARLPRTLLPLELKAGLLTVPRSFAR